MKLSILCITKAEPEVRSILHDLVKASQSLNCECVLVADGSDAALRLRSLGTSSAFKFSECCKVGLVESKGYIESVLDQALSFTTGEYILRIDDDERLSAGMFEWLLDGSYLSSPHWKFARAHVWHDNTYILDHPLWPDHQTRLSVRELSGGRNTIHCGSPHGGGKLAPVAIEHWKFMVKSLEQRQAIVDRYERLQPGAGNNFKVFSVPESVLSNMNTEPLANANLRAALEAGI